MMGSTGNGWRATVTDDGNGVEWEHWDGKRHGAEWDAKWQTPGLRAEIDKRAKAGTLAVWHNSAAWQDSGIVQVVAYTDPG